MLDLDGSWTQGQPITVSEAEEYIATTTFVPGSGRALGVEIERFPYDLLDPTQVVSLSTSEKILAGIPNTLPGGSWTATEPGGAVELASRPAPSLQTSLEETLADLSIMDEAFAAEGLTLVGTGLDPLHHRLGQRNAQRYRAMDAMFEREYGNIPSNLNNSCSVQVNVDCGLDDESWRGMRGRYRRLTELGPLFTAIFANSRFQTGRDTGWRSYRQRHRLLTFPEYSMPRLWRDPVEGFVRYALESPIYILRSSNGEWTNPTGITLRSWITEANPRPCTLDDLKYQMGTLFPPVKPRGYFELRMIDTPPNPYTIVPGALAYALIEDEQAFESTGAALEELYAHTDLLDVWFKACRLGLADPDIFNAAVDCCTYAIAALDRIGMTDDQSLIVADFLERYTFRGITAADESGQLGPEGSLQRRTSDLLVGTEALALAR